MKPLSFVFFCFPFMLVAQQSAEFLEKKNSLDYHDAIVYRLSGEIMEGLVRRMSDENLVDHNGINYVYPDGSEYWIPAKRLERYVLANGDSFVSDGKKFYKVYVEGGKGGLYFRKKEVIQNSGMTSPAHWHVQYDESYFFKKPAQTKMIELKKINYKYTLVQQFHDCPELVQRIKDKEFEFIQLESLVKEYNKCE